MISPDLGLSKLFVTVPGKTVVILVVVIFGLLVHGLQANQFGLYWDDVECFPTGMKLADGSTTKFNLNDICGQLERERPFQYPAWVIARAAFALSLPTLHWLLIGLLILNAALLSSIAY